MKINTSNNVCIFVCFTQKPDVNDIINKINRVFFLLKFDVYVIANTFNNEIFIIKNKSEQITIRKTELNDEMEFSGYFYAMEKLYELEVNRNSEKDTIFFINDTIFKHGQFRKIERISLFEWMLRFRLIDKKEKKAVGFWHKSDLLNHTEITEGYFNSKFFIFSKITLNEATLIFALNQIMVTINEENNYINNVFKSEQYSIFLKKWLNNKNGWYKSSELTKETRNFFLKKARSIIHEHLMSKRIIDLNIKSECIVKKSRCAKLISFLTKFHYQWALELLYLLEIY
nr:hypothetical protein [Providencia stuartii]